MKGGKIPEEIMKSFQKLKDIADKNHVSFEELCTFVVQEINGNQEAIGEHKRINSKLIELKNNEK